MSPPASTLLVDSRPPCLHVSALSPSEFTQFTKWSRQIQSSPSGVDGLLDEQDALSWLRKECAVSRVDEVKVLSLFDRYPLGLESGHFYALLRLTAWLQQGEAPVRQLIFTQTTPPATGLKQGTPFPLPTTLSTASAQPPLPPPQHPRTVSSSYDSSQTQPHQVSPPSSSKIILNNARAPSSKVPPPQPPQVAQPSSAVHPTPTPRASSMSVVPAAESTPPVPADSTKPKALRSSGPSNPFRDPTHSRSTSLNFTSQPTEAGSPQTGRDSPSNPFKPSKTKVIRPTPMVATPSNPNPAASVISRAASTSARSVKSNEDGTFPPLPPRPNEKPPPPLPPRAHISPLIQAGLHASMQVRKQKDALPPKTFTVLHSSSSRQKAVEPRLLTGESVPFGMQADILPPPTHFAKRKVSGHESKKSVSDAVSQVKRGLGDDLDEGPQRASSGAATVIAAPKASRPGHSRHHHRDGNGSTSATSHTTSQVAAPKAQYPNGAGSTRNKPNLPSWLREQEELQRSALIEGRVRSPPPSDAIPDEADADEHDKTHGDLSQGDLERSRRATTVLDEEFDVFPTELKDQASRAASIDRPNNPFIHRSSQVEAEKLKIDALPRPDHHPHRLDRPSSASLRSPDLNRPLGRSKTLHGKAAPPPPPPTGNGLNALSRKRLESFPATLDSGTFAGFRQSTQGGLRLIPPSAKADVGLGEARRPVPRRGSSALSISSSSGAAPLSHRGDEDSGDLSASTNPTSHERYSSKQADPAAAGASGLGSIKDRVSDFLKLQDAPPKGQRPIDDLKRDALRMAERRGWIKRNGEGEGLLREEDEDEATLQAITSSPHRASQGPRGDDAQPDDDYQSGNDIFDDAPMPDDASIQDRETTPTVASKSGEATAKARTPPMLPPKRANTAVSATSVAPLARRPSGYVARRASRIEERESRSSLDGMGSLGRAASFSVRATRSGSGGANDEFRESPNVNKRASWLEGMDARRRRVASESIAGAVVVDDDDGDEDDDEGGANRDHHRQEGWERLQ
ncbi:unnamed protein product [Sympodiomycopsis kandeliae]